MARTDRHAPGSELFDPEAYTLIDVYDLHPESGDHSSLNREIERLEAKGYRHPEGLWGCGHCGQKNIRYVALMARADAKEWIFIGETCLSNRFLSQTKASFQALRKAAQLDREAQRRLAAFREACDKYPALALSTYFDNIYAAAPDACDAGGLNWGIEVGRDIARKARRYGPPTERQAALLERIAGEQEAKLATGYERLAERAAREAAKATLPRWSRGAAS